MIISEGIKGEFLIPGVFSIVGAVLMGLLYFPIGILIGAFAIGLLLVSTGIEIDPTRRSIRKYRYFYGCRMGKWYAIPMNCTFELILSTENSTIMGGGGIAGTIVPYNGKLKSLTFDLVMVSSGSRKIVFEFLDYKNGKKALTVIQQISAIETRNKIAEKLAENRIKREERKC